MYRFWAELAETKARTNEALVETSRLRFSASAELDAAFLTWKAYIA